MSEIDLVWLVDADPPSDCGGGRGFYPANRRGVPPDEGLMCRRFAAIRDVVLGEAGGTAVLTVHTSPRFRTTFLAEPYAGLFRSLAAEGVMLALHPHEDRADGSSLYDEPAHLRRVIAGAVRTARTAGLTFTAFRSGAFAYHRCLPGVLAAHGIRTDLSAAPGLADDTRQAVWDEATWLQLHVLDDVAAAVRNVPLGWDGGGCRMDRNYLYNEQLDLAGLIRIWDRLRRSAARPRAVNFLTHGFGLATEHWRRQAVGFLRYARAHGGRLISMRALADASSSS